VEVLHVGFYQYRALKDGRIDGRHVRQVLATASEAVFGALLLTEPPPGVVRAQHKFAQRRLRHLNTWEPTRAEMVKLRDLVNHKAGRALM
jgi:hypothetical protein